MIFVNKRKKKIPVDRTPDEHDKTPRVKARIVKNERRMREGMWYTVDTDENGNETWRPEPIGGIRI